MDALEARLLQAEAHARFGAKADARAGLQEKRGLVRASLFDKQLAVVDDTAREKGALCPRRAGKTHLNPRYLALTAMQGALARYWAITRLRAKQLLWLELQAMDAAYALGCRFNDTELECRTPGGGLIRLMGADQEKSAHRKRGDKSALDIVDEAQLFTGYLQVLVEDVIVPGLQDSQGSLLLEGTPGPVCAGYWHKVSGGQDTAARWVSEGEVPGFSMHRWTTRENTAVPGLWEQMLALKKRRGWEDKHPTWVREYLGRWVADTGALFYKFDAVRNTYRAGEVVPWGPGWQHTCGWDLGKVDAMALVWWGWHEDDPSLYEAFSWKKANTTSDKVVAEARLIEERLGLDVVARVADTGGLGALVVEEVGQRTGMYFEAAKKTEKGAHVELFNGELLAGRIKALKDSPLAEEMAVLPKEVDWVPEEHEGKPAPEDARFPNHCSDAGLYSWRKARHFRHEPKGEEPPAGTPEAYALEAKRMEEEAAAQLQREETQEWWEKDEEKPQWWEAEE